VRRKRTSRRRWKKRAKLGCLIPAQVIVEHQLENWCRWCWPIDFNCDAYAIDPPPHGLIINRAPNAWWRSH